MVDNNPEFQGEYEPAAAELFVGIIDTMEEGAANAFMGDVYLQAFNKASLDLLARNERYREFLWDYCAARPDFTPIHANNFLSRVFQDQLYIWNPNNSLRLAAKPLADPSYPERYDDPKVWRESIRKLLENQSTNTKIRHNLYNYNVLSNVEDRQRSVRLIEEALRVAGRLDGAVKIFDGGCSRNHCLKLHKIAGETPYGFDITFGTIAAGNLSQEAGDGRFVEDPRRSSILNTILSSPTEVGVSMGVDIIDIHDKDAAELAESCSFYPRELLESTVEDHLRRTHYFVLEIVPADRMGISFVKMDLTNPPGFLRRDSTARWGHDIAVLSTMLYQHTEDERRVILDAAEHCVHENGVVVVQDFVRIDPNDPNKLIFCESWNEEWLYKTLIKDMRSLDKGWQEVFTWNGGRCQKVILGAGNLAMRGGESKPIVELLRTASESLGN